MISTPVSLLERLRQPTEPNQVRLAWGRFVELYAPLLYSWARVLRVPEADAADLVQDVFALLLRKLPEFSYDEHKRFRGWLWTVLVNKWREHQRQRPPAAVGEPVPESREVPDHAGVIAETEYRHYLMQRALQLMQADFLPTTWRACWEYVVQGRPAAEVAVELGISVASVYAAKSRVLRRLRQELAGLLD